MKIIFMGSPKFAEFSLLKLIENSFEITAVFTPPAKRSNRGQKINKSLVEELAEKYNLPVYSPISLKSKEVQELIYNINADLIIVVAYGLIIPKTILECKKYGAINVHPSSLPKFRGAAPLQHTILSGDNKTSVCIMQMDEGVDTGAILLKEDIVLSSNITYQELHDLTAKIGADLLIQTLHSIEVIKPSPQGETDVSYAPKILKTDAQINWYEEAVLIERKIRAFNPSPCTFFTYNNEIFKVFSANVVNINHNAPPGTILDDNLMVACGKNALQIQTIQRAGKNILTKEAFLRGYKLHKNTLLNKLS